MKDFLTGLLAGTAGVILLTLILLPSFVDHRIQHWRHMGEDEGEKTIQAEAVKRGHGHWKTNDRGDIRTFEWSDSPPV